MIFEIDQRVKHPVFGIGTVTHIKKRADEWPSLITVEFDDGGGTHRFQDITEKLTETEDEDE